MPYSHPDTPATHFHLDEEAWAEIGAAYRAGASALALAVKWKVSRGTIYINMKKRGWSKKRDGGAFARASHPPSASPPSPAPEILPPEESGEEGATSVTEFVGPHPDNPGFVPDPRWEIERLTAGEMFEPGLVATLAASASGGAMVTGRYADAFVLAQIALAHAKLVKLAPESTRAQVLALMQDRAAADAFFSHLRRDGEDEIKRAYWRWRRDEDIRIERMRDRIVALEKQVKALGGEAD